MYMNWKHNQCSFTVVNDDADMKNIRSAALSRMILRIKDEALPVAFSLRLCEKSEEFSVQLCLLSSLMMDK